MNIACLTFTHRGFELAERLQGSYQGRVEVFAKETYKDELPRIFEEFEGVVFVASTGIAVRLSAPFLKGKTKDPAIVVVDDMGRYAISLVSGHLGGANALAQEIAELLDCQPIITTASDARKIESIDMFAQRHHLVIADMLDAKLITGMMVDGRPIRLDSEIPVTLDYPHLSDDEYDGCIYVTSQRYMESNVPCCVLHPKTLHVGLGCRRGKTAKEIMDAITQVFQEENLCLSSIRSIATTEIKQEEPGILEAVNRLGAELRIFTHSQIRSVQDRFVRSEFVERTIGVSAVSEPCAYLAGGDVIVGKIAMHGVTVAVARETP